MLWKRVLRSLRTLIYGKPPRKTFLACGELLRPRYAACKRRTIRLPKSKARFSRCTASTANSSPTEPISLQNGRSRKAKKSSPGGWSKRKTLYGGDQYAAREDSLLDPTKDAAKIRAFFVHPDWARKGIGSLILQACEEAATTAGFTRLEMGATLSGVVFYRAKGYEPLETQQVPLANGELLPIVKMGKEIERKVRMQKSQ